MPGKYADSFEGTTGLKDNFSGKIIEAEFQFDSDYMDGTQLIGRIVVLDADDGEEVVLKLSTGKGWEDDDKGLRAKKEDGSEPGKGFNRQTGWFMFAKAAAELDVFGAWYLDECPVWDMTAFQGEPEFDFETVEMVNNMDPTKPRRVTRPVKYLGGGGPAGGAKKGATKSSAKSAAAAEPEGETKAQAAKRKAAEKKAAAEAAESGDDGELAKLKDIASSSDTHEEFMERAYGELEDADALEAQIMDEDFYVEHHG